MKQKEKRKHNKQKQAQKTSKKSVLPVSQEPKTLTGTAYNTIKWIAIITMVIDHIAFVVQDVLPAETYTAMRAIGRMAFPLFAFLIVECFHFTKSKIKHLGKIILIAVISEIPFDFVRYGTPLYWETQNVCFTLALGFLMLWITSVSIDGIASRISKKEGFRKFFAFVWRVNIYGIFAIFAQFVCKSEYTYIGIILIAFFEISRTRKHRILWTVWSLIIFVILVTPKFFFAFIALIDILVIAFALSKKQLPNRCKIYALEFLNKTAFKVMATWFYPVHLTVIALFKIVL